MDYIDTSAELWKAKVVRYRKWEHRHDRAVADDLRRAARKMLAELYVDLSNTAREIVKRTTKENGARWTDTKKPLRDETWTKVVGSHRYTLKHTDEEPTRIWFQRFEHEPWFDLGYWNDTEGCFQDVPVDPALVARNRAIDIQHSVNAFKMKHPGYSVTATESAVIGVNYALQSQALATNAYALRPDHNHIETNNTEGINMYERPEDLEAAAAHAMARAAELRAIDEWEPTGEEATVSWTWADEYEGAKTYTFVAFRTDDGIWYATGHRICRDGVKWRELALGKFGKNLATGNFHVVTEWAPVGGDE